MTTNAALFFPVFAASKACVPVVYQAKHPLAGCHLMRVLTNHGRPRLPAFRHAEDAHKALKALKAKRPLFCEVGDSLMYDVATPASDLDVSFVVQCDMRVVSRAIGPFMCDVCLFDEEDGVFVVETTFSVIREHTR